MINFFVGSGPANNFGIMVSISMMIYIIYYFTFRVAGGLPLHRILLREYLEIR